MSFKEKIFVFTLASSIVFILIMIPDNSDSTREALRSSTVDWSQAKDNPEKPYEETPLLPTQRR